VSGKIASLSRVLGNVAATELQINEVPMFTNKDLEKMNREQDRIFSAALGGYLVQTCGGSAWTDMALFKSLAKAKHLAKKIGGRIVTLQQNTPTPVISLPQLVR